MAEDRTTISITSETADELHRLKSRGDSYDDVIGRLLEREADLVGETTLNSQGKLSLKPSNGGRPIRYSVEFLDE